MLIDTLCYSSKLRFVSENIKFTFATLSLLFCVVSRSIIIACIILTTMSILTVFFGKISFKHYISLMCIPIVFLFLSTVAIIINISPTPLSAFAIPIFGVYITTRISSCFFALQLIATALASVSCLYFLSLSTPMTDILYVLKKWHCPSLLIELMLLIYRFIFIVLQISNSLYTAQLSRLGNINFKTTCKSIGKLLSVLLVLSFKRSSALYDAMESRCYNGTLSVLHEHHPIKIKYIIGFILFYLILITLIVFLRINNLNI